ncbi:MAG: diguanylate cyclase [Steroidobacteraceae bacterium]
MFKAVETQDWRGKYLDSLRTMERDERQFRDQQQSLYKLVGRLCLAAQGQSPRLDQELNRLKESLRREVGSEQLEPVGQAIADAVREIDKYSGTSASRTFVAAQPPDEPPGAGNSLTSTTTILQTGAVFGESRIRSLLSQLLTEVRQDQRLVAAADVVTQELAIALASEQMPDLIERVGGLVMQRLQALERMRQELEQLLGQLVNQLDSLTGLLEGSAHEEAQRNSSSTTLNLQITSEMRALGENVAQGSDVDLVRQQLRQRLDAIGQHLLEFREREEERARQVQQRTEQMRGRMEEMETEARKLKARLTDEKRLSMRDPLTQIPNRLAYEQRVAEELERWARFSQPTCIAVWDIDQFKAINDQYGHRGGDKVLTVVAECLARSIRSTDFLARYGGEEFVMLLPGTTQPDALRLAEEMREAVTQLGFHFRGAPVSITISCGVTALQDGDEAEVAFDRADHAMYRAKETGRNRVVSA